MPVWGSRRMPPGLILGELPDELLGLVWPAKIWSCLGSAEETPRTWSAVRRLPRLSTAA